MFDLIVGLMKESGYLGIALLMLLENLFPPIPSELIMPLAGFAAARGDLDLRLVVFAGAVGSTGGAMFWYGVGRWIGKKRLKRFAARHGRWLTLEPTGIDRAEEWFRRYAGAAVFLGRLVPAVRTLISVPAGIAEMPLGRFCAYSALGTTIWSAFLAGAGYLLESRYQQLSSFLNGASNAIAGLILAWYLYRLVAFQPERKA